MLSDSNTKAPGVYQFTVHNQEALPLKLFKNDVNKQDNPSSAINASVKVTNKETGSRREILFQYLMVKVEPQLCCFPEPMR